MYSVCLASDSASWRHVFPASTILAPVPAALPMNLTLPTETSGSRPMRIALRARTKFPNAPASSTASRSSHEAPYSRRMMLAPALIAPLPSWIWRTSRCVTQIGSLVAESSACTSSKQI